MIVTVEQGRAAVQMPAVFGAEYYRDPYPTLSWLRDHDPVHQVRFPVGDVPMWVVTRYHDVCDVLADPRFSVEARWGSAEFMAAGLGIGLGSELDRALSSQDPPGHARLRRLAMKAFTPRRIATWRDTITGIVARSLDRCEQLKTFDVLADYATSIPADVMSEILGYPLERIGEVIDAINMLMTSDPALMPQVPQAARSLCDYGRELVAAKRRDPGDDLTSAFVQASESGDRLDEDELVAMVTIMVVAGFDTTRVATGNAILALFDHPEQYRLLLEREDLDSVAVEEFLRYEGVGSLAAWRFAKEEMEFAGTLLPAGAPVLASFLSANRDPRRFTEPDRLDLTRSDVKHVALGRGLHNCLGAALARLELEIAIPALIRRFPHLRPAVPRAELRHNPLWAARSLVELPVETGS